MQKIIQDVPSPVNLRNPQDALEWANEANEKRPWRYEFFDYYVNQIQNIQQENQRKGIHQIRVLELGSGPGFLAAHLFRHCSNFTYTAVDFSEAMHELSRSRLLLSEIHCTEYRIADFKTEHWNANLAQYDVIIIHQALHELRHKHHANKFHQKVRTLLKPNAVYLICDHIVADGAMTNTELYMTIQEHIQCLQLAGFMHVKLAKEIKGLCLFECKVT